MARLANCASGGLHTIPLAPFKVQLPFACGITIASPLVTSIFSAPSNVSVPEPSKTRRIPKPASILLALPVK